MKTINLCGEKGCCPVIRIGKDHVEIGEEGNLCRLSMEEWDTLKQKIKNGEA